MEKAMPDEVAVGAEALETEQTETSTSEESSAPSPEEGGETETTETQEQGEANQHKRKGGWQRKIDRLEQQNQWLMDELLKRGGVQNDQKQVAETPKPDADDDPEPEAPDPYNFDGDMAALLAAQNKHAKDMAVWARRQAVRDWTRQQEESRKQAEQKTEAQKLAENWHKQMEAASAQHEDFEEVLSRPVLPPANDPKRAFIDRQLMSSEVAGELAYWLGSHPEEAHKIWQMDEVGMARALGRIEARFAKDESAEPVKKAEVPPLTKAPKPPTPVSKTSAATVIDPRSPESDKLSPDEWLKLRLAQEKRKK